MRQLFFIEDKLLGEAERSLYLHHGALVEPTSDLYFCHICGHVYARFPVIRADGTTTHWQSYRSMCRRCGPKHSRYLSTYAGSIWRQYDKPFLDALPVAVLQWEFNRHLDSLEKHCDQY